MSIRVVPTSWTDAEEFGRKLAGAINQLMDGRSNAYGSFTLAASTTSTVVTDRRVGTDTRVMWTPKTANAAAEIGGGTLYLSTVTAGSFTVTHASSAQTDRDFDYAIQG